MKNSQSIFVGVLAGFAAGMMVLAAFNAGMLAFFLFFTAPAAIYIASMGWGNPAGITGAFIATGVTAYVAGNDAAVLVAAISFGPAAYVGHLVNLGQPNPAGGVTWFPLSQILLRLMIMLAAAFILIGAVTGFTTEQFAGEFVQMLRIISETNPDLPAVSPEILAERSLLYAKILPLIIPAVWLLFHGITAFLSAAITRRSGLLAREAEDVAANLRIPPEAVLLPAAGVVIYLLFSEPLALAGAVMLSISLGGYGLAGLAHMHVATRGNPARSLILWVAYGSIFILTIPIFIFAAIGFFRSIKSFNNPKGPGASGPKSST